VRGRRRSGHVGGIGNGGVVVVLVAGHDVGGAVIGGRV
jgi:hypothetical protein